MLESKLWQTDLESCLILYISTTHEYDTLRESGLGHPLDQAAWVLG